MNMHLLQQLLAKFGFGGLCPNLLHGRTGLMVRTLESGGAKQRLQVAWHGHTCAALGFLGHLLLRTDQRDLEVAVEVFLLG